MIHQQKQNVFLFKNLFSRNFREITFFSETKCFIFLHSRGWSSIRSSLDKHNILRAEQLFTFLLLRLENSSRIFRLSVILDQSAHLASLKFSIIRSHSSFFNCTVTCYTRNGSPDERTEKQSVFMKNSCALFV